MIERQSIWYLPTAAMPTVAALAFDVEAMQADTSNDACIDVYDVVAGTCTRYASAQMQANTACGASFAMVGIEAYNTAGIDTTPYDDDKLVMLDWLLMGWDIMPALSASLTTCPHYQTIIAYITGNGNGVSTTDGLADAVLLLHSAINRINAQYAIDRRRITYWMTQALLGLYPDTVELPPSVKDKALALSNGQYAAPATQPKLTSFNRGNDGWR